MTHERYDAIVLGGGPSGLAASERLAEAGMRVALVEADTELGGLAKSFCQDGKWIPMTYHHVMGIDTVTHGYLKRFGLWESMVWKSIKVVFWFHGKAYPLTQPWHILGFAPLTPLERLRLVRFGVVCYCKKNWHAFDAVRSDEWIERMLGRRAREAIFEPLAEMEFGTPLSAVSSGWLGYRLHESARNRSSYGYPSRDLKTLIDGIAAAVEEKGGRIMRGVEAVKMGRGTVEAVGTNGKRHRLESPRIVSAVPPEILLRIHEEPGRLDPELATIRYRPLICMCFGSRHLISPHYWNVFMEPVLRFGGIFNHTALFPQGGARGEYVYYLFSYVEADSALYRATEEELAEIYIRDIRTVCPKFDYLWRRIFKIPCSTPRYGLGYANPPVESRYPGLFYTGVYRRYPCTRTMHTALLSGCETAAAVLKKG